jgi:hypothetical protein
MEFASKDALRATIESGSNSEQSFDLYEEEWMKNSTSREQLIG